MEDKIAQLPWEALKHTEGEIPWSTLYKFAAEVVVEPSVMFRLYSPWRRRSLAMRGAVKLVPS